MRKAHPSLVIRLMVSVCFVLLLSRCSGLISSLETYSGETLYDTAVKANGDLLALAPNIQSDVYEHLNTEKEKLLFQAFQRDFISGLVKENPEFAKEFYNKMHSRDQTKINEALTDAGALVEEKLKEYTGKSEISAESVVNAVLESYKDA